MTARGWVLLFMVFSAVGREAESRQRQPEFGTIAGVVVTGPAQSPAPLRRAVVVLSRAGAEPQVVTTDDEGRFTFAALPFGRYQVESRAASYVGGRLDVAPERNALGAVLQLSTETPRHDVTLRMTRGAVIAGVVRGPQGAAWPSATVTLLEQRRTSAGVTTVRVSSTRSDDRGEYRFYGLRAGTYLVSAVNSQLDANGALRIPASWLSIVAPTPGGTATQSLDPPQRVSMAPTFHPDQVEIAAAHAVTVTLGAERVDVDIDLRLLPAAVLSGSVVLPTGVRSGVTVELRADAESLGQRAAVGSRLGLRPDGTFASDPLPPGRYQVHVRGVAEDGSVLWARQGALLDGTDVRLGALALQPGIHVDGRVSHLIAPSLLRLRVTPVAAGGTALTTAVDRDGAFTLDGLLPGEYRVDVSGTDGSRISLREAHFTLDGSTLRAAVVLEALVNPARLHGVLRDAAGRPVTDYAVVVFSKNEAHWQADAPTTRVERPDQRGGFDFSGLAEGEYVIAVLTDLADNALDDPAVFRALRDSGIAVLVTPGANEVINLVLPVK